MDSGDDGAIEGPLWNWSKPLSRKRNSTAASPADQSGMQQFAESSQNTDALLGKLTQVIPWNFGRHGLPSRESSVFVLAFDRQSKRIVRTLMVNRREPRKDIRVPVRIFGTDANGKVFNENVFTVNVSRSGAMVIEVKSHLKVGETIGIVYGQTKGRYQVRWVGPPSGPSASLVGLESVKTEDVIWDFPLPASGAEGPVRGRAVQERRQHVRRRCSLSVELHPASQESRIWGRVADISLGGCFVEMSSPLKEGTQVRLALWIQDKKLWTLGKVAGLRLGSGIGIEFLEMKDEDREQLKRYVDSLPVTRR